MKLNKIDTEAVYYEHEQHGMHAEEILKYTLAFRQKPSGNLARTVWVLCQKHNRECPVDVFKAFWDSVKQSLKPVQVLTADEADHIVYDKANIILEKQEELERQGCKNPVHTSYEASSEGESFSAPGAEKRVARAWQLYRKRYPDE